MRKGAYTERKGMEDEKRNKVKKQKGSAAGVVKMLFFLAIGALAGLLSIWVMGIGKIKEMKFGVFLISYGLVLFGLVVWIFIHTILHEAGHLVCGLLSGYRYCSFRIGRFTLAKYPDGMKMKRFSIPGTAGQCLMAPPPYNDGSFSYKFYLLGGFMMNLICAAVLFVAFLLTGSVSVAGRMLAAGGAMALYLGIVNAVPAKSDIPNDGYQIFMLGKSRKERRAFWESLEFNARLQQGTRIRELEKDWEAFDNEALVEQCKGMNGITALAMRYSYLIDTERFAEAEDLCQRLLKKGSR